MPLSSLDAGARLIELFEGLVFAGPGPPGRIVHALEDRERRGVLVRSIPRAPPAAGEEPENKSIKIAAKSDDFLETPEPAPSEKAITKGWQLLAFTGLVLIGAGVGALGIAATVMEITVDELNAVNPRLVPLIAHDRAGFGGGLFSGGLTVFFSLWCGARPGAKGLWAALCCAGIVGFAGAIGIHPIVGTPILFTWPRRTRGRSCF